ncbi:MAG: NIPSNAP family protein [Hyphomonadaceae bacterium]|nr:NIPSNAP family protein [Hyphomonadaceae bacterium]MBP9234271.1 NIPSNAP family protein [Hyphomonadaceae bacterium]
MTRKTGLSLVGKQAGKMTTLASHRPSLLRRVAAGLAATAALLASACASTGASTSSSAAPAIGLYELRIYTASAGKMDALDARFRDHTVDLFKRHGMTPIGFFHVAPVPNQPADNRLFYIMGYKDRAARDASWSAFAADPEWKTVYAESQKDGSLTSKIENIFLNAAEYAPKLNVTPSATARHFELRTYTATPGKLENVHARFRDHTMRIFSRIGMTNMMYWRPVADQPQMAEKMVYLLSYPNAAARTTMWQTFGADEEWKKVSAESQKDGPLLISPGGVVSVQLTPTDYSPLR